MDEQQQEETALLVAVDEELGSPSEVKPLKNLVRDARILSFAFLLIFSAYQAAQNLQSTVNTVRV